MTFLVAPSRPVEERARTTLHRCSRLKFCANKGVVVYELHGTSLNGLQRLKLVPTWPIRPIGANSIYSIHDWACAWYSVKNCSGVKYRFTFERMPSFLAKNSQELKMGSYHGQDVP